MAAKRGQSEAQAVPGAGCGEEGEGGALPPPASPLTPPPPPPSSTPPHPLPSPSLPHSLPSPSLPHSLPSPPPPPSAPTAARGRNALQALFLIRKTSAGLPMRRVFPDHGISLTAKDKPCEKDQRTKKHKSELFNSWGTTVEDKEATQDVCAPSRERDICQVVGPGCALRMASTRFLSANGRRSGWGRTFELRFGNTAATKKIRSAEATVSESGVPGDNSAEGHKTRANQDLTTLVVSTIHDLLSFNPETTIIEFDSDIGGRELGRLFRIAKVLKFTRFVPNYTLARARLHYIRNSSDGERRGRNLDAEAEEVLCHNEDKKK